MWSVLPKFWYWLPICCCAVVLTIVSIPIGASERTILSAKQFSHDAQNITGPITIVDVHGADGANFDLSLEPFEVWAPDARLLIVDEGGIERPIERPKDLFFRGNIADRSGSRVFLSVDPDGEVFGLIDRGLGLEVLSGRSGRTGTHSILKSNQTDLAMVSDGRHFQCDQNLLPPIPEDVVAAADGREVGEMPPKISAQALAELSPLRARIAIETDYEFFQRFASPEQAATYVGNLIGYSSMLYGDELDTQLEVSFLRLWNTSFDPWNQSSARCALFEFGQYWNENMTSESRTVAHMLSGKHAGGGVAWLGVLCSNSWSFNIGNECSEPLSGFGSYGGAYAFSGSITGDFNAGNPTAVWDIIVTAHEIGHNFNSPHTHCFGGIGGNNSPVDQCWANEQGLGCFGGTPSLPGPEGQGSGTIMSYCHLQPGGLLNFGLTLGRDHPFGVVPERVPARMFDHAQLRAHQNPGCFTVGGNSAPSPPVASAASTVREFGFTANWGSVPEASSFVLDVSTQPHFSNFVPGFQGVPIGAEQQYFVSGLTQNTTYFYRVRATNASGTSANSNVVSVTTSRAPTPIIISGSVREISTGNAIPGATVVVSRPGFQSHSLAETKTDNAGDYALEFLINSPTEIVIEAAGPDHAPRRFGSQTDLECAFHCAAADSGHVIVVDPDGSPPSPIIELARTGGRLKGSVHKAESGAPLEALVSVFARTDAGDVRSFSNHFSALTGLDGVWETPLALPSGKYHLLASASTENRVDQGWDGFDCQRSHCFIADTTPVTVQANTVVDGFDFPLRAGASIRGRADLLSDALSTSGLRYILLHDGAGQLLSFEFLSPSGGTGDEWQVDGLLGGSYYAIFGTPGAAPPPYLRRSFNGTICNSFYGACAGIGAPITVPPGEQLSGVDHEYALGGGLLVNLVDAKTGDAPSIDDLVRLNMDIMDASGERVGYMLDPQLTIDGSLQARTLFGVPPGMYYVRTYDGSSGRGVGQSSQSLEGFSDAMYPAVVCAGSSCDMEHAEMISVSEGEFTEVTIELTRGRYLYGQVRDRETDEPLPSVLVMVVDEDNRTLAAAFSDSAGNYRIGALPPNNYRLRTSVAGRRGELWLPSAQPYFDQVWGANSVCTEQRCDPTSGSLASLDDESDAGPFNFELQPGPVIRGRLVDQTTRLSIGRGRVDVFTIDDQFIGSFYVSSSNNRFQTVALSPGTYRMKPVVSPAFIVAPPTPNALRREQSASGPIRAQDHTGFFVEINTTTVNVDFELLDRGLIPDIIFSDNFLAWIGINQWFVPGQ